MKTLGNIIEFIPTAKKGIDKLQDIQDDNDYWQRLKATGQSIADDGGLEEEDGILNVGLYGEAGEPSSRRSSKVHSTYDFNSC